MHSCTGTKSASIRMFLGFLAERRAQILWRALLAFTLLGCARYGVWYVHEQHVAYAASRGHTVEEMWHSAVEQCYLYRSSFYDYTIDLLSPLNDYFAYSPRARDALVQFVSALEVILLGANLWLFVFHDIWILPQFSVAFVYILVVMSASWTPILCNAIRIPVGAAWVSDALAGGITQLPLGGLSGSTVLVCLGLYNVYVQRRATDLAFLNMTLLAMYVIYHLVLRWHSLSDELFAIASAMSIIAVLHEARVVHRIAQMVREYEEKRGPFSTAGFAAPLPSPRLVLSATTATQRPKLDLSQVAEAYVTHETLTSGALDGVGDNKVIRPPTPASVFGEDSQQFQRPSLHGAHITIYSGQ